MESDFYRTKPIYLAAYGQSLDTFIGNLCKDFLWDGLYIALTSPTVASDILRRWLPRSFRWERVSSNFRAKLCIVDYLAGCVSSC